LPRILGILSQSSIPPATIARAIAELHKLAAANNLGDEKTKLSIKKSSQSVMSARE
jgi:hypothetical protein